MALRSTVAFLLMGSSAAFAAQTGGFATTDGGNVSGAKSFTARSHSEINSILANARIDPSTGKKVAGGAYPVIITYTGNEDALINQVIKDHTPGANGVCPSPRWNDAYREVQINEFTKGVTIQGANGSSANFGITMVKSANVIIRNMKIGALGGGSNDADMLRIDNSSNIWIDHNELFALNVECKGSPEDDLTFESALDIKKDAQNITVSYNVIRDSKKVGLMGHTASSGRADFQRTVTYHHNIYRNVNGRLPLQRGGWIHVYNNLYEQITGSGINVRSGGYALIENNWFQNARNPLTCRFDTVNCGKWELRNNNTTSAASNATYGIVWDSAGSGGVNAQNWSTTGTFPITLPYSYQAVSAQCVKDRLASYAGVGKNGAQLTAAICNGSSGSSAGSGSSSGGAPALVGSSDYPTGFSKCADLNGRCAVTAGTGWVAFGRKGNWVGKYVGVGSSIACTVAAFGSDPGGNPNKCSTQN
ncbi:pectate lyase family protein [Ectopseudomonas guguanensis]|uniref:pectate lyase family protein n=1 Tax=Ectopseudomonas guguanensis TaxID=1198456 RepID=UPI0023567989|nr:MULTISPECIES: right-handed parallel beta-helix repeat-containing protein [Pseudomonas]MDR8017153.1 pectate lyase [Pseudomonas guguanensis]